MDAHLEDELLTSIVAATRERLGAAACSVALLEGDELVFRAASGEGAEQMPGLRLPVRRGIAGYVVSSGQAIAVGDVHADQRFDRETAQSTGYVPTSILAVPVDDEDGSIGVLEVLDRDPGVRDLEIAAAAAQQVELAVRLGRRGHDVDVLLASPELGELVDLVRQLGRAPERDRVLAAALLTALLQTR